MKKLLVLFVLLCCVGCKVLLPNVSKADSEEKQLQESRKQTKHFERIAIALEKIADN